MAGMNSKFIVLLALFDILVSVLFVASNLYFWQYLNGVTSYNEWDPLQVSIVPQNGIGGPAGTFSSLPNFPFILFWVALIGNFVLFVFLARSVATK